MVLLDVRLPDMDGLAVVSRRRASHTEVPVIVVSAIGAAAPTLEATRLGVFYYVTKPSTRTG